MISWRDRPLLSSVCRCCTRVPTVKYVGLHCPLFPYSFPSVNACTSGVGIASPLYPRPSRAPGIRASCLQVRPPNSIVVWSLWSLVKGFSTGLAKCFRGRRSIPISRASRARSSSSFRWINSSLEVICTSGDGADTLSVGFVDIVSPHSLNKLLNFKIQTADHTTRGFYFCNPLSFYTPYNSCKPHTHSGLAG